MFVKTVVLLALLALVGAVPTEADGIASRPLRPSSGNPRFLRPWNPIKIGDSYPPGQPVPLKREIIDVFAHLNAEDLAKVHDVDYSDMDTLIGSWSSSFGDAYANES